MGRSRLTLKHITSDTSRKSTFKQRRDVLVNKMQELSNLCNAEEGEAVEACLVIYDTNGGDHQPMTWPENLRADHALIQRFESEKNEEPPIMFGIEDYFKNKKEKVDADISKVRKEILKIQYPTSHPSFNNLEDEHIRNFIAILDAKSKACNERINELKWQHEFNSTQTSSVQFNFNQNNFETQLIPTPMLDFDPNAMQLMVNNDDGVMNSTNEIGLPLDCATQSEDDVFFTNQLDDADWGSQIDREFLDTFDL